MAVITRRRTGEFLRKLFELLITDPSGVKASTLVEAVGNAFSLTEYEKGLYPSGGQRFEKILRFATVDCVKAGWLQKNKGLWLVTEAGQKAYTQFQDPEIFYKEACRLYGVWKAERDAVSSPDKAHSSNSEIEAAAEKLGVTFEEAEEHAWGQIEDFLKTSDPFEFQDIVADLLRGMGYHISWISPPGKDGGIDIIAYTDPLGATGPRIKVQVKRWKNKVDSDALRSFIATINGGDVGIFVCLAGFTKDAADCARNQESRRMTLIDARRLVDLWVEHYARLEDTARRRLPLVPIYFLAPRE
ncbi:restriction endonuclease [Methylobacterium trifolii]